MTKYEKVWSSAKIESKKLAHYFQVYEDLFSKWYGKDITYLELGVNYGGSLEVASKLFGKGSNILGCDIQFDKASLYESLESNNIAKVIIGDVNKKDTVNKIKKCITNANSCEIIVDDCGHDHFSIINSFNNFFPLLSEGGVYVIEDTQTQHAGIATGKHPYYYGIDAYDYFNGLTRKLNDFWRGRWQDASKFRSGEHNSENITQQINSISFFECMIVIQKQKRSTPVRKFNNHRNMQKFSSK